MANRALEAARAIVNAVGAGLSNITPAQAGYDLAVFGLALSANGAIQVTIQDDHTSLLDIHLVAGQPYVLPASSVPWARTTTGDKLDIVLSVAQVNVDGVVLYRPVTPDQRY